MAVEDDLQTIKQLQDNFKQQHGAYFESDWASPSEGQNIGIPINTDELNLTKIKRFIGNGDELYPRPDITEILFAPTAKNYKFLIGRGIEVREDEVSKGHKLNKDYWYCKAEQIDSETGVYTTKLIEGGDLTLSKFKDN